MIKNYVSVDLETTGLLPKSDRIIEVGALRVRDGEIVDTLSLLLNPGMQITEKVTEITGITGEELKGAPDIDTCFERLFDFLGDDILLGHRILFDYSFLKRIAVNKGREFERNGIDTLKISRKFLGNLESRTLSSLCQYYHIPIKAHRALGDATATHYLYKCLSEDFDGKSDKESDSVFLPEKLIYKVKKESPITKAQIEQLGRLLGRHQISLSQDIDKMTKNEASRMIDKILAKYGR